MSAAADRRRDKKDFVATFLTTNIIPQDDNNNNSQWKALENELRRTAIAENKDFYIIAGGNGINQDKEYIKVFDNLGKEQKSQFLLMFGKSLYNYQELELLSKKLKQLSLSICLIAIFEEKHGVITLPG